jgi:hypothetical protein
MMFDATLAGIPDAAAYGPPDYQVEQDHREHEHCHAEQ